MVSAGAPCSRCCSAAQLVLAAFLLLAGGAASAHGLPLERRLLLQRDELGLVGALEVNLHGREVAMLTLHFDLDHNGRLDDEEEQKLAAVLVARGAAGVSVAWRGIPLLAEVLQVRLSAADPAGALAATGLLSFDLEAVSEDVGDLSVIVGSGAAELDVLAETRGVWRLLAASSGESEEDGRGLTAPVTVTAERPLSLLLVAGRWAPLARFLGPSVGSPVHN